MKGKDMKTISKQRLEELKSRRDDQIDYSEIPELDENFWQNIKLIEPDKTQIVTLRVKKSVLDAYKKLGKGYQTRMNQVLETYVKAMGE